MATHNIDVRDARDRLIDLLGIGETYPLLDLPVRDDQLMVPFDNTASLPIVLSQDGVTYTLHDKNNAPVNRDNGQPFSIEGNSAEALLETPKIDEDITFKIQARKPAKKSGEPGKQGYLHETATVKVGLDVDLKASIQNAPTLDATIDTPEDTDPRIVDYGAEVEVELRNSQEGVDYRLVTLDKDGNKIPLPGGADVRGDFKNITLSAKPVTEDIDIRIRATKTFEDDEDRDDQIDLLKIVLPLRVRANPALAVSTAPAIIDFGAKSTVRIANTQKSAKYQLYIRAIPYSQFVHGTPPSDTAVVSVPVTGEPNAQVKVPPSGASWQTPAGYVAVGEAKSGTGGDLSFDTGVLNEDTLAIIEAKKDHQAGAKTMPSALQLTHAAAVLVEPNPAQALTLAWQDNNPSTGKMKVTGGQPGVFYYFRFTSDGADEGLPAYFHKQDENDSALNKGIEQSKIGVGFVITRVGSDESDTDLARTPPPSPLLEIGAIPDGATALYVRAVKAQTRVAVQLAQQVAVPSAS
uniref:Uncharacterized protein n=1 Tax=Candidatus Kentrum sp. LPFa TaxID=2126335 RepID=A0A450W8V5_9GAMM|nr:MAG: hypothetical protein BECKLPF1236B_GA0070989_10483 [Candidatus Kentron sp. LPFa]